jgi:hypothetical protein
VIDSEDTEATETEWSLAHTDLVASRVTSRPLQLT